MSETRVPVLIRVTDFYVTDLYSGEGFSEDIEKAAAEIRSGIGIWLGSLGLVSFGNVSVECAGHEGNA